MSRSFLCWCAELGSLPEIMLGGTTSDQGHRAQSFQLWHAGSGSKGVIHGKERCSLFVERTAAAAKSRSDNMLCLHSVQQASHRCLLDDDCFPPQDAWHEYKEALNPTAATARDQVTRQCTTALEPWICVPRSV